MISIEKKLIVDFVDSMISVLQQLCEWPCEFSLKFTFLMGNNFLKYTHVQGVDTFPFSANIGSPTRIIVRTEQKHTGSGSPEKVDSVYFEFWRREIRADELSHSSFPRH